MNSDFLNKPEPADNSVTTKKESPETYTPGSVQKEFGGRTKGLEPSRFGDWEKNGRCIDF